MIPPRDHDYTQRRRCWSHDFGTTMTGRWMMHGWGSGLRVGDHLLVDMQSGKVGRLRITKIEYQRDPPDMWFLDYELDGYQ